MAAERSIDKEVVVQAPIERVWQAWTTRAGIESFFAPEAEIDPRVGGAFHIHMDPLAAPGMKGADDMRFMALQRPTMLSFDWNAPPSLPEARGQRTFVVVRLAPIDAGTTRVTLHHTGWGEGGEWDKAYAYFDRAWPVILGKLKGEHRQRPVRLVGLDGRAASGALGGLCAGAALSAGQSSTRSIRKLAPAYWPSTSTR